MVIGDDEWTEIVGEQTRDTDDDITDNVATALGSSDAFEILGEMVAKSPAFTEYARKRVAAARPLTQRATQVQVFSAAERDALAAEVADGALSGLDEEPPYGAYCDAETATEIDLSVRSMIRRTPVSKARDWSMSFGPVSGAAGSTTTITMAPRCLFRGEKIVANDTGTPPGMGTRITGLFVGSKPQMPQHTSGTPTTFFSNNSLGSGVKLDTCQPSLSMSVTVHFVQSCTFDMHMFGKAVV